LPVLEGNNSIIREITMAVNIIEIILKSYISNKAYVICNVQFLFNIQTIYLHDILHLAAHSSHRPDSLRVRYRAV
jgi:hypothetical protein